jgi:hypothetical protein
VEVDGKFADAVLGTFGDGADKFVVALEGKGPKDPLDRPYGGRHMSAVDQGYRYHPHPVRDNFRGLFGAINRGSAALGIHAYNGGLFAEDPLLDHLVVADDVCAYFRELGDYDYRPAYQAAAYAPESKTGTGSADPSKPASGGKTRAVPVPILQGALIDVDILGHIFEQSITDLEKLRNELGDLCGAGVPPAPSPAGETPAPQDHKSRRKKEVAFYTPAFVTRYIIEQALGGVLRDRFEQLRRSHQEEAKGAGAKRFNRSGRLRDGRPQEGRARGPGPLLGGLAGRAGQRPFARSGLRQRGLTHPSLRPTLPFLSAASLRLGVFA